jgi:hypothetical protein
LHSEEVLQDSIKNEKLDELEGRATFGGDRDAQEVGVLEQWLIGKKLGEKPSEFRQALLCELEKQIQQSSPAAQKKSGMKGKKSSTQLLVELQYCFILTQFNDLEKRIEVMMICA